MLGIARIRTVYLLLTRQSLYQLSYGAVVFLSVPSIDEFQINEINVDLRTSGFDNEVLSVDACAVWWERESFYCLPRIGVVTWHREPRFQCGSARTGSIWNSSIIYTNLSRPDINKWNEMNEPKQRTITLRLEVWCSTNWANRALIPRTLIKQYFNRAKLHILLQNPTAMNF